MNRTTTLGLTLAACLLAAIAALAQPKPTTVLLTIEVTGPKGHYIDGLQPRDFRIIEDGIVQKLSTFAGHSKQPVEVLEDGNTRPSSIEAWRKHIETLGSIREPLENSYIVTYVPAPNPNQGFRKIEIQIVSDTARQYRVRSRPGYRPQ